ncbi:MAG: GNAT family N-acetyltransferase [Candidatus Caenarcaniphilales bacterium]|nr:GNAT family N-acetyltransferase [Candidatus Caenarcaniphilales bacterium]
MKNDLKIESFKHEKLSSENRHLVSLAVKEEFGKIQIIKKLRWSKPTKTILASFEETVVGFVNIVERNCNFDDDTELVAGLSNLIVLPEHRGKGYGLELMNFYDQMLTNQDEVSYGLLFCSDSLVLYYQRLNWYLVKSEVTFSQPFGKRIWGSNTMLKNFSKAQSLYPKTINLNGLPW